MELLNMSLTIDQYGAASIDTIIGRDVAYSPYPGPVMMELLRTAAGCTPGRSIRADLLAVDGLQALMHLPAMLTELAEAMQKSIEAHAGTRALQLSLFS